MSDSLQKLTLEAFQAHINEEFVILLQTEDDAPQPYPLTLEEAVAVGDHQRDLATHGRESFSLVFTHPDTTRYLQQGTYPLQHAAFPDLLLFLVPLGPRNDRMAYEVIVT